VVNVGLVAKTSEPVPVSSVAAVARFALDGVAIQVPTPVPRDAMPEMGRLVALLKLRTEGVPRLAPDGIMTDPVKVGLARFAFKLSAVVTKAVVASCVVFVAAAAVGAAGVPVKVGLARFAFKLSAVVTKAVVASCVVDVAAAAVGAAGTPVRVGLASGA